MRPLLVAVGLACGATSALAVNGTQEHFARAVAVCRAEVQREYPGFDAYVDGEGTVNMWTGDKLTWLFCKCMHAHGEDMAEPEHR